MSATTEIRSAPHIKSPRSVEQIMRNVVFSLLPICAFFVYQYGLSAAASILVVTAACLLTERLFVRLGGQAGDLSDYSATITGVLLGLTLPPGFPLWMGFVAGFTAIALGKALFGGIGFNVFNPALVGRAFVQAAFPSAIASYTPSFLPGRFTEFIPSSLAWPLMAPADTAAWLKGMQIDAWTGATPLAKWKFEGTLTDAADLLTSLAGHMAVGPSPALILLCGAYLALRRFMDWRIPAAILGSAGLTAWLIYAIGGTKYPDPFFMLFSGGLILGAVLHGHRHGNVAGDAARHVAVRRVDRRADRDDPLLRRPARGRHVRHPDRQRGDAADRADHPADAVRQGRIDPCGPFHHLHVASGLHLARGSRGEDLEEALFQEQAEETMNVANPMPSATPAASLVKTLGLVSALCGVIIVGAYQGTYEAAAANRRIALERTVFKIIPTAKSMTEWQATAVGIRPAGGETPVGAIRFYAGYDEAGALVGIAVEGAAKGYADVVRILYGYSPECQCVNGLGVVATKETPGIGDKIITDEVFLANFKALDVKLDQALARLANEVKVVKHGSKTDEWQIDAISGATVTSRAVGKAISDSAQSLLPKLLPNIEQLRKKES